MTGKEKCEILRQIRLKVAQANNIDYTPAECTHEGDCSGTCPMCDGESRRILSEIRRLKAAGQAININRKDIITLLKPDEIGIKQKGERRTVRLRGCIRHRKF